MQVGDYLIDFEHPLGTGRFSRVYSGTSINGESVAVKVFKSEWVDDADQEIRNLQRLSGGTHPCVLRHIDILVNSHISSAPMIVFPLLGPDMLTLIRWRYGLRDMQLTEPTMGLPWWLVAKCAQDILEGVAEYHRLGLMHCDIKPENIMLSKPFNSVEELVAAPKDSWNVVVADAGSSLDSCECKGTNHGTDPYRSPEFVSQQTMFGPPVDVASIGAVVYELRTRDALYNLHNNKVTEEGSSSGGDRSSESSESSDSSDTNELHDLQTDMRICGKMQSIWGRFPRSMRDNSKISELIWNSRGGVLYAGKPPQTATIESVLTGDEYRMPPAEATLFGAFLHHTCALWPDRRLSAADAAHHVWITQGLEQWPVR
jgi:serine/threonine protein kinase